GHRLLDFNRVDLQSADVDEEFQPAGDEELARYVDAGQIAGGEEAVGSQGGIIADVAGHHRRGADEQLPVAVDARLDAAHRPPDRGGIEIFIRRVGECDRADFCGAVKLPDSYAAALADLLENARRQRTARG